MFKIPKRDEHVVEKINLIPIMDAVFILIFFLLFSAQFIKIYEITSDAPIINELPPEEKLKKDPLNLIIKINTDGITITTGLDSIIHTEIPKDSFDYNYEKLKQVVLDLKKSHLNEKYAIVAPEKDVKYEYIIKIIDAIKLLPENQKQLKVSINGEVKTLYNIFDNVVLEPLENQIEEAQELDSSGL